MYEKGNNNELFHVIEEGVKCAVGFVDKIEITPSEMTLNVGNTIQFTLKWQTFDFNQNCYVDNESCNTAFQIKIGDMIQEINPVNGVAQITFQSNVPGEYMIETLNSYVTPAIARVVVKDA